MKLRNLVTLAAALILPAHGLAEEAPEVSVSMIRIVREVPPDTRPIKTPFFEAGRKGSAVALTIKAKARPIVAIDSKKSSVDAFTDSGGKSLLLERSEPSAPYEGFVPGYVAISDDHQRAVLPIYAGGLPGAGSTSLSAKGTITLTTAARLDTEKSAPIPLAEDTEVKIGKVELFVSEVVDAKNRDGEIEIELLYQSKRSIPLAKVTLHDATTLKEFRAVTTATMNTITILDGERIDRHIRRLRIKKPKGKIVLQVGTWIDKKTQRVPFSVTAGLGG